MTHTPGPWSLDEVPTSTGRAFRMGAGEMLLAGKGCCIIYDDYGHGNNERRANAHLIATAPDMLAALKLVECLNSIRADVAVHKHIAGIIAKAEGKS